MSPAEPHIHQSNANEDSSDELRANLESAVTRYQSRAGLDLPVEEIVSAAVREVEMAATRLRHAEQLAELTVRRDALIVDQWRSGLSIPEIAVGLDLPRRVVQTAVNEGTTEGEKLEHQRKVTSALRGRRFTDDEALDAIRKTAAELGRTPPAAAYDRIALREGWPRAQSIANHFGAWSRAVRQAGFEPHRQPKGMGLPKFTDEQYASALRRVRGILGHHPSVGQYNALSQKGEPTAHAFRKRYGSWVGALNACLGGEQL